MGIYYYKLFELMAEKDIAQKSLMQRLGISSTTFAKMRNNESVTLDVLDRIREELGCDFGDMITAKPKEQSATDIDQIENRDAFIDTVRTVLNYYMEKRQMTPAAVSSQTGLSVNTVKSFLKGNPISSQSYLKLIKLGEEFNSLVNEKVQGKVLIKPKKKNFCDSCGKRNNRCWASQSVWIPEKNEYEKYCAFGIEREQDETGAYIAPDDCPHPSNYKEFAGAKEQYEFKLRGKVEYIPAEGEK